jgi:tRNA(His) 5'-end guanylyltransferase
MQCHWKTDLLPHFRTAAAMQAVLVDYPDVRMAFGQSDEYSFVLHKNTTIYGE